MEEPLPRIGAILNGLGLGDGEISGEAMIDYNSA